MDKKFKNYYLAKSNPQETIQQHTDKLLQNLDILRNLYPNLFLNWDISYMLELACLYHDIGKINISFQKRITGGKEKQIVPHGLYSLCFLEADDLYDKIYDRYLKLEKNEDVAEEKAVNFVTIVANAIAYHHERDIPSEVSEIIKNNLESLREQLKDFKYDKIKISKVEEIAPDFFMIGTRLMPSKTKNQNEVFKKYILVKGLLNRIDYASSAGEEIQVERKNDFLLEKLENMLENWRKKNPQSDWNELQKYMIEKRDKNVITIAQTGMGKTEAGLLWIGDTKGFFILPLKTAINSIYNRITTEIVKEKIEDRVGLLHSETKDIYLKDFSDNDLEVYYESTKQLSLPLTICTLDQIFDFVYRYKGFEPKLATLSYSKIVLDEIQMYSPDLLAYIIKGLKYITELGGKFAILTATFPEIVKDLLFNQGVEFEVSENFTKPELNLRHNVKIIEKLIDTDFILSKFQKNKILVICNTVKEAQRIYTELKEKISDKKLINLFHSKFIKRDRAIKESEILKLGNKNNKDFGIWIATQVVEASLDIDFDILITELSDLSGLFQRMGRCYRNRPLLDDETNCFVFTGDEKIKNTGVGFVVDKDIYTKSKDLILEKIDGNLFEEEKMKYVSELYTTENLKETKYYKKVLDTLEYLDLVSPYEKDKQEVKKEFRDITSYMIIPKNLYEENSEEINKNLEILKQENISKKEKLTSKMKIRDLTLNIQGYELKTKNIGLNFIELGKYEKIYILDCDYSFEIGFIPNTTEEASKLIDERFL
ncbi:MAG: CRISPR-associated helicase Cas3' [Fusobacterium sp.]|uniref:CRISPR-associated helicase Cas3' n=1 Tax=Fusobacterium sp. TaxID=68766 RepID=UPI002A74EAA4|nr:CRISPR-associated helicase Cas3' [Fusobacterium sp.]MDY2981412.1 CRISPR-associated helicase Cas3' [Fusobacterium sp.]